MEKYKIYCDLDGVLVDFNKGYLKLTGIDIGDNFYSGEDFWKPLNKAGVSYWDELEWMPDGKKLWNYIKDHNPPILSAPSREVSSRIGKLKWVKREIPDAILIFKYAKDKKELATPNSILIDDRPENVEGWIEAGGIGIHHKSTKETIKELKKLGI